MAKIQVYLLGQFQILVDGTDIIPMLGNSKKKLALIQYLLLHQDTTISNSNLFEHIWPGEYNSNPESSLKTLVSRLRRQLKSVNADNLIITKQGSYVWNSALDICNDVDEFQTLCHKASLFTKLTPETEEAFNRIIELYQGDLLHGYDSESWIVPKSMYFHNMYLTTVYSYLDLLKADGRYNNIMLTSRKALQIDQFDSKLNLALMTAMLELGMKSDAMNHYNYTVNLHYTQLGITPSSEILAFYKNLVKADHDSNTSLDMICKELMQEASEPTAFICEYSIFKDIYKLNMRNMERLNITIFLGLVTLLPIDINAEKKPERRNEVMDKLMTTLKYNLRKGDVISRYGPSQVAILLPAMNQEGGNIALERVKQTFYSTCAVTDYTISYKVKPILSSI